MQEPTYRIPPVLYGRVYTEKDFETRQPQWWISPPHYDFHKFHVAGITGQGVAIVVVDTGAGQNSDIDGAVVKMFDGYGGDGRDDQGHGTLCASTAAAVEDGVGVIGVAPRASIVAAKGLDRNGSGSASSLVKAIDLGCQWAVDNFESVILSMSWGSSQPSSQIAATIQKWLARGVLPFAAAGNSGPQANLDWPARFEYVVAVGAVDKDHNIANFSSHGEVDLTCPGVNMKGALPGNRWQQWSGTSASTPWCAGAFALLQQALKKSGKSPLRKVEEVFAVLDKSTLDLGDPSKDTTYGRGILLPEKFLDMGPIVIPPPPVPPTAQYEVLVKDLVTGLSRTFLASEK